MKVEEIKKGLRGLSELRIEDLTKVSSEVLQGNIESMLSAIRVLESQLKDTMEVNAALRTESKMRDADILALKRENQDLQFRLRELEKQVPLVDDVEKRFEIALERIEEYKTLFQREKDKTRGLAVQVDSLAGALKKTEEERNDAYKEVVVLMNKLEQPEQLAEQKGIQNG
ncbi:hypothetical protein WDW37_15090 [Bdellovibrionota bacterium FG-1]